MSPRPRRFAPLRGSVLPCVSGLLVAFQATPAPPQEPAPVPERVSEQDQDAARVLKLTLEDALVLALRNNFDLEIERLATEVARYNALGSWGAFDPVLNVTGAASEAESEQRNFFSGATVVEDNDLRLSSSLVVPFQTGANLELAHDHVNAETNNRFAAFDISTTDVLTVALTQPLLRGAWRRYSTSIQRLRELDLQRQLEREREVRARLLLDVYNSYWDLVSSEEELDVREVAVELGNQQLAQDIRRKEVGAGTEVDVLQSETNVAQQEELRLQADYTVRQARDLLRRLLSPRPQDSQGLQPLGSKTPDLSPIQSYDQYLAAWDWPIETLTPLPEAEEEVQLDWRASLRSALERRPELAQFRIDIETAEVELQRARSERLPLLDLDLRTSSAGFDPDPQESFDKAIGWDFPSSSAALTFSMPLWNRTASNAERAARASLRGATLVYDRVEVNLLTEVRTIVNEVDKQRESVRASIKSRNLAQRQLEAEETRQQVGLSTTFQVLEFQEDLAQALSTEVSAKAAYAKALARLAFVEGRLGASEEEVVRAEGESGENAAR